MKKIKMLMSVFCVAFLVLGLMSSASALTIDPTTVPQWTGVDNSNLTAAEIATLVGYSDTLFLLYKQNVGGSEEGPYASSYTTTFSNTPSDPMDAKIEYVGGPNINGDDIYLYVKDGAQEPAFYIFDLSAWNGTDTIMLSGFWPAQGAISHVDIYGPTSNGVPEPTTILLIGSGLIGLWAFRRKFKN